MELKQQVPSGGLQLVQSYGSNRFKVAGILYQGSIIVLPDTTAAWQVNDVASLSLPSLQPIIDAEPAIEILIVGCGTGHHRLPLTLVEVLRTKGIGVETMDTGAACRTYNVLVGEGRRVAAALIAL